MIFAEFCKLLSFGRALSGKLQFKKGCLRKKHRMNHCYDEKIGHETW